MCNNCIAGKHYFYCTQKVRFLLQGKGSKKKNAGFSKLIAIWPSRFALLFERMAPSLSAPRLIAAVTMGLIVRVTLSLGPYSGQGKPPMYGDLEAQRHWMEVTANLPLADWYRNTTQNDLNYWGLDYPPLTAYAAWALGRVANLTNPVVVELGTSRGIESPAAVVFMRLSALLFDLIIYIPAILAYAQLQSTESAPQLLLLLLLEPALLLMDHGHFQWNSLSLGLAMCAVTAIAKRRYLVGSAAFALALNVKQMQLYYAPAFFIFLLAVACMRGGLKDITGLNIKISRFAGAIAAIAVVGIPVIAVFAAIWAPFCVLSPPEIGCEGGLNAVLKRLFPFDRSLFEDKVANVWCALDPVLRLRSRIYADSEGHFRARVAAISAAVTGAMMLPALIGLAQLMTLDSDRVPDDSNVTKFVSDKGMSEGSSPSQDAPFAGRLRRRKTVRGPAGDSGDRQARGVNPPSVVPSSIEDELVRQRAPTAWQPYEQLLLTMSAVSTAFFLASYQVHEKGILLPLLPMAMLRQRLPLTSAWFSAFAVWSMWPLLAKDGLIPSAVILTAAHAYNGWPRHTMIVEGDGIFLSSALRGMLTPAACGRAVQLFVLTSFIGMAGLSVAAATLPAPAKLPDIHPYASAVYGAGLLVILWAALSAGLMIAFGRKARAD